MTTLPAPTILDVDWIVLEETTPPPAAEPTRSGRSPDRASPDDAHAIRPWAKPLLTGALVLAAIWLAGLALIILDGALFAQATIRSGYGFAGIPLCCLIAIAFIADPDHESNAEEVYFTLGSVPSAQCTPSRNTITGRPS